MSKKNFEKKLLSFGVMISQKKRSSNLMSSVGAKKFVQRKLRKFFTLIFMKCLVRNLFWRLVHRQEQNAKKCCLQVLTVAQNWMKSSRVLGWQLKKNVMFVWCQELREWEGDYCWKKIVRNINFQSSPRQIPNSIKLLRSWCQKYQDVFFKRLWM